MSDSKYLTRRAGTTYGYLDDDRPTEDSMAEDARRARTLVEDADRIEKATREADDRRDAFAGYQERHEALRALTDVFYGVQRGRDRRRAVRSSPVYATLPPAARKAWDELLDASDRLVGGRDGGIFQPAAQLARQQAQDLEDWAPEPPDVADDLARIPRA